MIKLCLIFDLFFFTNADVVTTKDETPIKKICETDEGPIKEQDVLLTTFPAVLMSTHWLCLPT